MTRVNKRIQLSCEQDEASLLGGVIRSYADAAFPPGGSTCAQASREALHGTGDEIEKYAANGGALVSRRQQRLLRSAVSWYFSEVENSPEQEQLLLRLLENEVEQPG